MSNKNLKSGSTITTTYTTKDHGDKITVVAAIYLTTGKRGNTYTATSTISTVGGAAPGVSATPKSTQSSSASTSSNTSVDAGTTSHQSSITSPPSSANGGSFSSTASGGAIPASSSSPAVSPSSSNNSNKFTSGDLAGAAVGCLVGGALIAFLIAFLIFRRRKPRDEANSRNHYPNETKYSTEKSSATVVSDSIGAAGWLAYLPQSADDRTIQNAVRTFFNQIELHVDNFYHRHAAPLDPETSEALSQVDSGKLPGPIENVMQDPRMVIPVIKHSIAELLITRLSPLTYPETSLLPAHLAEYPPKLQTASKSSAEEQAIPQAYSQWRLLNAYLYPHPEKDPAYLEERAAKANDISELLFAAFSPWQAHAGDKSQHQHENGLVATAANLGILLMSQPSAFEFRWSPEGAARGPSLERGALIAFPGFWKTTDDQGRALERPQNLVPPSIPRI